MTRPKYDPTISLGSLVTSALGLCIVPFLVWLVSSNYAQDSRLTGQDLRITNVESAVSGINKKLDDAERRAKEATDDIRIGMRRLDDKLGAMLMQNYRPGVSR